MDEERYTSLTVSGRSVWDGWSVWGWWLEHVAVVGAFVWEWMECVVVGWSVCVCVGVGGGGGGGDSWGCHCRDRMVCVAGSWSGRYSIFSHCV